VAEVAATGAMLLARGASTRRPPVPGHLPDGSSLPDLDGPPVRIIEADPAVTGAGGSRLAGACRLIPTLTGYRRDPAAAVVRRYHERRQIEPADLALRHTLLGGHVLRPGDRPGIDQEVWALLTLYQLLRTAMVTAAQTRPGTDPDRASFTTAPQAARDQLTAAPRIRPDGPAGPPGAIGRAVPGTLLPARRPRSSARNVTCPTSRHHARDDGRPALPAVSTGPASPSAPRRWTPATARAGPTAAGYLPSRARTGPPAAFGTTERIDLPGPAPDRRISRILFSPRRHHP